MSAPELRVEGFLPRAHVCSVMGTDQYPSLAGALRRADRGHPASRRLDIPLEGIHGASVHQLEKGEAPPGRRLRRAVANRGHPAARQSARQMSVSRSPTWGWRGHRAPIPAQRVATGPSLTGSSMPKHRYDVGAIRARGVPRCAAAGRCCRVTSSRHECEHFGGAVAPAQPPTRRDHVSKRGRPAPLYLTLPTAWVTSRARMR